MYLLSENTDASVTQVCETASGTCLYESVQLSKSCLVTQGVSPVQVLPAYLLHTNTGTSLFTWTSSEEACVCSPGNVAETRVAFSLKRCKAHTRISFPDVLSRPSKVKDLLYQCHIYRNYSDSGLSLLSPWSRHNWATVITGLLKWDHRNEYWMLIIFGLSLPTRPFRRGRFWWHYRFD